MAYKKPQIVAKCAAKQSFVAGCGTASVINEKCTPYAASRCQMGKLK